MDRDRLDRYITGSYGEKEWLDTQGTSYAYIDGVLARRLDIPLDKNPYEGTKAKEWASGWCDEDQIYNSEDKP